MHMVQEEKTQQQQETEKQTENRAERVEEGYSMIANLAPSTSGPLPVIEQGPLMRPGASTSNTHTEKSTKWAVNTFNNWRHFKAAEGEKVPELREASTEELNFWLAQFVRECKQKDGRDYKHHNLYAMMCGLGRYIKKDRPNFNILDDPGMTDFKTTLQQVIKRLQAKQANICTVADTKISRRQWDSLWEQGLLGESNPAALFNAVYFLFVTVTGLTSGVHLRALTITDVVVTSDLKSNSVVTTYYPSDQTKLYKADRGVIRCTETNRSSPRSFGRLLELYLSRVPPECNDLWQRPNLKYNRRECTGNRGWFSGHAIGQNQLRTTVRSVCDMADFSGHYSTHSLDRDLLNWEHYNIEHLSISSSDPAVCVEPEYVGIKREYVDEEIPEVTLNTRLPTSNPTSSQTYSKRLKTSKPLPEQIPPSDSTDFRLLSSRLSQFFPELSTSTEVSLSPPVDTAVSNNYSVSSVYPDIDVESTQDEAVPPQTKRQELPALTRQVNSASRLRVTPSKQDSSKTAVRMDQTCDSRSSNVSENLRNVNVNIPGHVDKCMGLFKDCTIQNVTINIYLSKSDEDSN
ncbi:hypothetical protein ACHWQZ_G004812 [Mnemiopsis leidyi]